MAGASKKDEEETGGEFADFLTDISQEIAQRVESLEPKPQAPPEVRKATPASQDAGLILEWENVVDRMIEDMR